MLKMTVTDLDHGSTKTSHGTEQELLRKLQTQFHVARQQPTLEAAERAVNESGHGTVEVSAYYPNPADNLISPASFEPRSDDDEWPREADLDE